MRREDLGLLDVDAPRPSGVIGPQDPELQGLGEVLDMVTMTRVVNAQNDAAQREQAFQDRHIADLQQQKAALAGEYARKLGNPNGR